MQTQILLVKALENKSGYLPVKNVVLYDKEYIKDNWK